MEPTHQSTLTDCDGRVWTVVASPFGNRFLRVSQHVLLGPLVLGRHPLDLLCEENASILQYTEGDDDLAKDGVQYAVLT